MSDLAHMMSVAPGTASFFMGQNQRQKNLGDILSNDKLRQDMEKAAYELESLKQMDPLKRQHQMLQNQGLEAGLPGITAESTSKQLKAKGEAATLDSSIAATNAENKDKVSKTSFDQFERGQKFLLQAGAQLEAVPPPMRAAAFRQMVEQAGMNANANMLTGLMNLDPQMLPEAAKKLAQRLGDQALTMNPAARASMYGADQQRAASKYSADSSAAASRYATDQRANAAALKHGAGDKANKIYTGIVTGKIKFNEALLAASLEASTATDPEIKQFWQQKASEWEQLMYNRPQAGKEGELSFSPGGGVTPRTVAPVYSRDGQKPRGSGTKDDPIKLD